MLRVNEMFESISGEAGTGIPQGAWCTFIRLQGCNLACSWCDTPKSQKEEGGTKASVVHLLSAVKEYGNKNVIVTGGEPLLQPQVLELIQDLVDMNFVVQVETNGSLPIPCIPNSHWVVDRKGPSSGVVSKNSPVPSFASLLKSVSRLYQIVGGAVCLKYVVATDLDLQFALDDMLELIERGVQVPFAISPLDGDGRRLLHMVDRIKQKGQAWDHALLDQVTFSIQLHKLFNLR